MKFLTNDDPDLKSDATHPMQFTVESSSLLSALTLVQKSVKQGRYGLEILKHVQIEATGAYATIRTTDLITAICVTIEAEVSHEGMFTIPAKLLLDCVKTFPKGHPVEMQVVSGKLFVACGKRSFGLKDGTDGSGFPLIELPEMEGQLDEVVIESGELRRAFKEVSFAAAKTYLRPIYLGVCLHLLEDHITFTAFDEHHMAHTLLAREQTVEDRNIQLLPIAQDLRQMMSLIPDGVTVAITWDQKRIAFQAGNITFLSRLIEGQYPDCAAHLRKTHASTFTLQRISLVSLLQGIDPIFKGYSEQPVRISYTKDAVVFHAESDMGEINDLLMTEVAGEDGQIQLDACRLAEMLEVVKERAYTFGFSGAKDLVVITPVGRSDFWYGLMPMG